MIVTLVPSGKSKVELDGYLARLITESADGTKSLVLIDEFGLAPDTKNFEGYSIYCVSDKVNLITDGVISAKISASGNAIAFVKDYDYYAESGTLYLWNNGKTTLISDSMRSHKSYCISPDGKTVAFASGTRDDFSGACYYNGRISDLGKNIEPFAVADKAKYIYYDKNYTSYVMLGNDGGTKQKLASQAYPYYFNKDLSEMVFQANGKTYAVIKGEEKISLSGAIHSFILPDSTQQTDEIIGVKSFANTLYISGDDIIRIDDKFEASSAVKKFNSDKNRYLASDGRTLLYMKNDDIYKVDALNKNATAVKLVDGDAGNFEAVNKGSAVYFVNEDDELYYQKGTGKPVYIADDVTDAVTSHSWEFGAMAGFKDKILYYLSDSEVYATTGKKGKLVSGIDEDAVYLSADLNEITIVTSDSDDDRRNGYGSFDGKTFIDFRS
jgi:hypothetical protein